MLQRESGDKTQQVWVDAKYANEGNGFQNLTNQKRSQVADPFILYSKSYAVSVYVSRKKHM